MKNLAICFIFAFLGSHLIAGKSVGKSANLKEKSYWYPVNTGRPEIESYTDMPYTQMSEERMMPWITQGPTAMPWYQQRTTMAWNEEPITNSLTTESSRPPQTKEASTPVFKDEDTQTHQPTDLKRVTAAPQYSSELKVNLNLSLGFESKSIH